jgi:DNA-binding NarL/FixJ family response regulator
MEQRGVTCRSPADPLVDHASVGADPPGLGAWPSVGDDAAGPRVFVVDDNHGLRVSIRELLTDAGVEVVGEAADSLDALRKIPPAAYARGLVVLMDVRLPGPLNGIEATRLLVDRCERLRVLIFTAFPGEGIEQAARHAGAVELLAKGCPAEMIVDAVTRAWSGMVPIAP